MQKQQSEPTEEHQNTSSKPNDGMGVDGFPDFENEVAAVTDINNRMQKARDEWEKPDNPEYVDYNSDTTSYRKGVIRSIEEKDSDSNNIRIGLDTGKESLEWIQIQDTEEMNLSNPYVKLCKMYGTNPESAQELYGKTVYIRNKRNNLVVQPQQPIIKQIWSLQHFQHKHKFYTYKQKNITKGLVPTYRFFVSFVTLTILFSLLSAISEFAAPITLITFSILSWGLYTKCKYDILPYIGSKLQYYWTVYSHKKA